MSLSADRVLGVGIPDDDVGVGAGDKFAFARIQAEQARGSRRNQLDETVEAQLSLVDAVMKEKLESIFYAGTSVGDLGEIVFA